MRPPRVHGPTRLSIIVLLTLIIYSHSQKHLLCKHPDKHNCLLWLVNLQDVQINADVHTMVNIPHFCGLSDKEFVASHGKYIKVRPIEQNGRLKKLFCNNVLLVGRLFDWKEVEKALLVHPRVRRQSFTPRGRYRGQTQSQYLTIDRGNGKDEGRAEAHSAADSSRASVSGNSGMGQAQSQSIYDPNCDNCYGKSNPEVENLKRPVGSKPGESGYGPNSGSTWPGHEGFGQTHPDNGGYNQPTETHRYIPEQKDPSETGPIGPGTTGNGSYRPNGATSNGYSQPGFSDYRPGGMPSHIGYGPIGNTGTFVPNKYEPHMSGIDGRYMPNDTTGSFGPGTNIGSGGYKTPGLEAGGRFRPGELNERSKYDPGINANGFRPSGSQSGFRPGIDAGINRGPGGDNYLPNQGPNGNIYHQQGGTQTGPGGNFVPQSGTYGQGNNNPVIPGESRRSESPGTSNTGTGYNTGQIGAPFAPGYGNGAAGETYGPDGRIIGSPNGFRTGQIGAPNINWPIASGPYPGPGGNIYCCVIPNNGQIGNLYPNSYETEKGIPSFSGGQTPYTVSSQQGAPISRPNGQLGGYYNPATGGSVPSALGQQYGLNAPRNQYVPGILGGTTAPGGQYIPGRTSGTTIPGGQYGPGGVGSSSVPGGQYIPGSTTGSTVPAGQYGPGGAGGSSVPGGQYIPGSTTGSTVPAGQYGPGGAGGSSVPGGQYIPGITTGSSVPGGQYSPGGTGGTSVPGEQYIPGSLTGITVPGSQYGPGDADGSSIPRGQYPPGVAGGSTVPGGQYIPGGQYGPGGTGGSSMPGGLYIPGGSGSSPALGGQYVPSGISGSSVPRGHYIPGSTTGSSIPGGQYRPSGTSGSQVPRGQYIPGGAGSSTIPGNQYTPGGQYGPGGTGGSSMPGGVYIPGGSGGSSAPGGQYVPGGVSGSSAPRGQYRPGSTTGSSVPGGQYELGGAGGSSVPGDQYGQDNTGGSSVPGGQYGPGGTGGSPVPGGQYIPGGSGGSTIPGGQYIPGGAGGSTTPGGQYIPGGAGGSTTPGGQYIPGGSRDTTVPGGQYGTGGNGGSSVPGGLYIPDGTGSTSMPGGQYIPNVSRGTSAPGGQYGPGGSTTVPGGQYATSPQGYFNQGGPRGQDNEYNGIPQNYLAPDTATIDSDDSEAEANVAQNVNGTTASASSKGGNDKGRAQTSVQGTYTGSGSFQAQAQITSENKEAQSEVSGGKKGASSSASGSGRNNKSQANVQLGSETGSVQTQSQSNGIMHSSNSQVQGSVKGGMADAQARGPGSTSSQAQIGFTPYKDEEKSTHDLQRIPFMGGGMASAQSSGRTGQSQSQLHGTFKYGITYNGAAQSGASLDKDAVFPNRLSFEKINVFDEKNKNINVDKINIDITETPQSLDSERPIESSTLPESSNSNEKVEIPTTENVIDESMKNSESRYSNHAHIDHHISDSSNFTYSNEPPLLGSRRSFQTNYGTVPDYEFTTDKEETQPEYDTDVGSESEGNDASDIEQNEYSNYDEYSKDPPTHEYLQGSNRKGIEVQQTTGGNTQHIILGSLKAHNAEIIQKDTERPDENKVYQPGERVPGTGGYTIPVGFTGSIKSVASKDKTYVVGSKDYPSQAQTVTLTPGTGKVKYTHPSSYGKYVKPKNLRSLQSPNENDNRYVSVSKSVTRALDSDNNIRKQYSHTYYTKSSSCGYFTFTCTMVSSAEGRKKVCKPKMPTNPDGTPIKC